MTGLNIVALGDSLTQGFVNGATARPRWSYPSILARALGLEVPGQHRILEDSGPGFPLDIERLLAELTRTVGQRIVEGDWLTRIPQVISAELRAIEEYYERGPGARPRSTGGFHNIGSLGVSVNDALTLTSATCQQAIDKVEGWVADDLFGLPSAPVFRTAQLVLNPSLDPWRERHTMIDALAELAANEPVDALLLWLGANDCLPTVLQMKLADMPEGYADSSPFDRRQFTLTSASQFERDYSRLVEQVARALDGNPGRRQVYVGTVPHVTIPPVTYGLGSFHDGYFEAYGRFYRTGQALGDTVLTRAEVERIDRRIDAFNCSIRSLAQAQGWHVVDTVGILDSLAVKRNGLSHDPGQALRNYLRGQGYAEHPLLQLNPVPSCLPYTVTRVDGLPRRTSGGIFGLDFFHPTTIGYGLVAEHYLDQIKAQNPDDRGIQAAAIDWPAVIAADGLISAPPVLWADLSAAFDQHAGLWDLILRIAG